MECLTDNLNRSASEVRAAVQKAGGKMADPGSVMFNFQRQGQVFVSAEASEDQVVTNTLFSQPVVSLSCSADRVWQCVCGLSQPPEELQRIAYLNMESEISYLLHRQPEFELCCASVSQYTSGEPSI